VHYPARVKITTTTGIVRRFTGKLLIVEADDHRVVWFQRADDFKMEDAKGLIVEADRITPGDHVMVKATQDDEGYYKANLLRKVRESTAADRVAAALTWDLPTEAQLPAEARNDRPVIKRGGPAPKPEPSGRARAAGPRPTTGLIPHRYRSARTTRASPVSRSRAGIHRRLAELFGETEHHALRARVGSRRLEGAGHRHPQTWFTKTAKKSTAISASGATA